MVQEITSKYPSAVKAERDGANILILHRIGEPRRLWSGGPLCAYELQYLWLSSPEADTCEVKGSELTYWTATDGRRMVKNGLFAETELF